VTAPKPGTAEWLRYMTASKIAAVVGTSPYESRFSLWHRMAGNIGPQPQSDAMEYGHYLEPVLLKWFADKHPEFDVRPGLWETRDGWAGATPDGAFNPAPGALRLVQCKTSRLAWEWDNGVPPGYVDQCQWEMWVTGAEASYVVADVMMEFREYAVERDDERIAVLVTAGREFMDSIAAGTPPDLDGSLETYLAVRELHPDIDPIDYEVPAIQAHAWLSARDALESATEAERVAKTTIADLMGTARRATFGEHVLFTRQARNGGTPYLVAGRDLPKIGALA